MNKFMTIDVNIFAIVLCLLIFFDVNNKIEKNAKQNRIFVWMLLSTIALSVCDLSAWLANGNTDPSGLFYNHFFNYMLYIVNPLPALLWVFYVRYQINFDRRAPKKFAFYLLIPYALYLLLLAVNPFTNAVFYVDDLGFYHRGKLFIIALVFVYDYIFYAYFLIIRHRKKMDKRTLSALLLFPLPPAISGLLQSLFFGTLLTCPGIMVSLFILYINIQNNRINTDYLTGLFNRREADNYLQNKVNNSMYETFSAIILDIDKFKEINDKFGHHTGDDALESVARVIKGTLRSNDFVARYGGDEFLIILNVGDKALLETAVNRIRAAVDKFNKSHNKPYHLSLSMGYDVYDARTGMNDDQFVKQIDMLMYLDKNMKQRSSHKESPMQISFPDI